MTQVLLEPALVERARHLLGKRSTHAENVERGFAEAFHQLAREHLADRAVFWRRDPVHREFRAMHHQLTTDLDFGSKRRHSVPDDRIIAKRRRGVPFCHHMFAQLLKGMRHLQNDPAANQPALEGERARQHLPSAIDLAYQVPQGNADVVIENVGKGSVIHGGRRPNGDARRIHGNNEHADSGVQRLRLRVCSRGEEHVFSPPGRGPDFLTVNHPGIAVTHGTHPHSRQVGAGLGLAVPHAVHGLAAQNFWQIFPLLLRRAEHHQRIGLDRGTDAWRLAPLHGLDEGNLLQRGPRLAAKLLWPSEPDPARLANITREFGIEFAL